MRTHPSFISQYNPYTVKNAHPSVHNSTTPENAIVCFSLSPQSPFLRRRIHSIRHSTQLLRECHLAQPQLIHRSLLRGILPRRSKVLRRNQPRVFPLDLLIHRQYVELLAAKVLAGSQPQKTNSAPEDAIPAETLHKVACIMRQIIGPRSADAFATALWSTASEMGYRPSTLSLARQLVRSGAYGRVPQLRRVEARFKGLVSSGKDADALTAEGELLLEQGRLDAAAAVLTKALKLSPRFEWRPYCRLCLGRAYLKMGKVDDARGLFEKLAQEGLVEADMELAEMLRGSDADEARQRMYTAACNGRRDMFTRLSEMELELEAVGGEKDGEERRLWAMEWSKLADGRVEY